MQRVNKLKDTGKGKDCLIIGGGTSVLDFNFEKCREMDKIAINDSFPPDVEIKYCIFNDICFLPVYKKKKLWEKCETVISNAEAYYIGCKYYYREWDLPYMQQTDDTGLKAIVIAKEILNYDNVYLIGFDFYTIDVKGKKVSHFYGDEVGKDKKYATPTNLENHLNRLSKFVPKYEKIKHYKAVYNCNKYSALRLFPHAMPCAVKKSA